MDKRFLLTIVLCFAISVIYMDWITPPREPQPPGPTGVIPGVFPQGQPADGQPGVARGVGVLVGTDPVVDTVPVVQEQLFLFHLQHQPQS